MLQKLEKEEASQDLDIKVRRSGKLLELHAVRPEKGENFGLTFMTATNLPRPKVVSAAFKNAQATDIKSGDIFLTVNKQEVYSPDEAFFLLSQKDQAAITLLRGKDVLEKTVAFEKAPHVILSEISPGSEAEKAGFQNSDILLKIGETFIETPEDAKRMIQNSNRAPQVYTVLRGNKEVKIEAATDAKNTLGILLQEIYFARADSISFYQGSVLTSLIKIHDVKYPFTKSLSRAWSELTRLTKVTLAAFGRTLKGFVKLEVPEDVGGPVQIAYYTHTFVQEGFFALMRFTALLSLSLAVINILPFPALDGGRFFFIILEVVFRRRMNARLETLIHSFGFAVLILLILLVTFSDFAKIFS